MLLIIHKPNICIVLSLKETIFLGITIYRFQGSSGVLKGSLGSCQISKTRQISTNFQDKTNFYKVPRATGTLLVLRICTYLSEYVTKPWNAFSLLLFAFVSTCVVLMRCCHFLCCSVCLLLLLSCCHCDANCYCFR